MRVNLTLWLNLENLMKFLLNRVVKKIYYCKNVDNTILIT